MTLSVYLSYAHADEKWAHELLSRLTTEGYDVSDIPIMLESADVLLVITTPTSVVAEGVKQDLDAFAAHRKTVIPIIPPSAPHGTFNWIPHHLGLLPYVDFVGDFEAAYAKLKTMLGEATPQVRQTDIAIPRKRHLPLGFLSLIILLAALIGAFALPADSPIPRPVGYGMLAVIIFGLLLLLWGAVDRARHEAAIRRALNLPDAFVEVIESSKNSDVGRRWQIKGQRTHIGRQRGDHIHLGRRGVSPQQCSIVYDPSDDIFYLETAHPSAITTLHDKVLERDQPLPMWNGDLIMLTQEIVLQFRFGTMTKVITPPSPKSE